MRKSARKLASVLALATGLTGSLFLTGCGNPQENADLAASDKVKSADEARASAENSKTLSSDPKLLDAVQTQYDTLANDTSVSPQTKLILKAKQAQLSYERVLSLMANLKDKELAITRNITAIDQLASQIEGSQKYVAALQTYDPTANNSALKARQVEIDTGDQWKLAAHTAEDPAGELTFPTVAKLQSNIDDLSAKIAKTKADIDALKKTSADNVDQAETLTRKSETETGNALVADSGKASELRKDAAVADAQAESLRAALATYEADLDSAQVQKTAVSGTSQTFVKQVEMSQTSWAAVQAQIDGEKKMQQKLIAGNWDAPASGWPAGEGRPESIADHATKLKADLASATEMRSHVIKQLNDAIKQFGEAEADAQKIRGDLINKTPRGSTDASAPIWEQQKDTLHPTYFTIFKGGAQTSLATVMADEATIDSLLEQMFDGYSMGPEVVAASLKEMKLSLDPPTKPTEIAGVVALLSSEKTGTEMPKDLADITRPTKDQLATEVKDVYTKFDDALKTYDTRVGTDSAGPEATERTNTLNLGKAITERQWAQFALMIGKPEDADRHIKAAVSLEPAPPAPTEIAPPAPPAPPARPVAPMVPVAPTPAPAAPAAPATPAPATPAPETPAPATPAPEAPAAPAPAAPTGDMAPATPAPAAPAAPAPAPPADAPAAPAPAAPADAPATPAPAPAPAGQ